MSARAPTSQSSRSPIRVLLVDDHRCMLWGLERLIDGEQPKMQVVGTATGTAEARQKAAEHSPDVVLLDLDLDGERGVDLLPALTRLSGVNVLVLTGSRDDTCHREAMLQGARGVVCKDAPADVLLNAIERVHAGEIWLNRATVADLFRTLKTAPTEARESQQRIDSLTKRERQIIRALVRNREARGREVAASLFISEHTLRNHLTTIFGKLGLRNRLSLVLFALEHKLID